MSTRKTAAVAIIFYSIGVCSAAVYSHFAGNAWTFAAGALLLISAVVAIALDKP